ncbi:VOC family protein [Nocardiopsis algeriensis]|uniref:Catechol 2,3-dioxygenase-like lactoylglutathione lyase family enzyme n=1 Tax=Nocardiopsis algeriensis TaxID=1478215 RepID=A0A841IQY9_9ACTN|nr:VOC family protein [Nocardiopsis algeriensis]MBB6120634.1 catechol 2,3-dioxygenase-like lactoylglutathione lyase family enzyme [Nocardiopsis algeriensis]
MDIELIGTAYLCEDPRAAADWFAEHLGFEIGADLGWYANTRHPRHGNLSLDFVGRDHASSPEGLRGRSVAGALLAFLVPDADAEEKRLREAGLRIVLPLVSEPWGRRRFQVAGPQGLFVEILQRVEPDPRWMRENGLAE